MIKKVQVENFKRFSIETFHLDDRIVLAGPNNSGKSTLLQAVSVWNLALSRWLRERRGKESKATERTGVPIARQAFSAVPLRDMNLLWTDRSTAYSKDERPGYKPGSPKPIRITLSGVDPQREESWELTLEIRFQSKELVYVKLLDSNDNPVVTVSDYIRNLSVAHVPPFSGIGAEEARYDRGLQDKFIGQGKPGEILRNLIFEVFSERQDQWNQLRQDIEEIFHYRLLPPNYVEHADAYISVEYEELSTAGRKPFDIASAGSGFHQVLTILSFFYARPASLVLLDEPDAHQHIVLQRAVFDRIKEVARKNDSQLLVSTHSEIILEDTPPENILSLYGSPHRLEINTERNQVREALKLLSTLDILACDDRLNVFYTEDLSDFKILRELAKICGHQFSRFFDRPFHVPIHGRDARVAKNHFFALKAINPEITGALLLDGDNRNLPEREITAEGLLVLRWDRYEIENYLLIPEVLARFIEGPSPNLFSASNRSKGLEYLQNELPPAVLNDPLGGHEYLRGVGVSKSILPEFFQAANSPLKKKDYFLIAEIMQTEEVHSDIIAVLDKLKEQLLFE